MTTGADPARFAKVSLAMRYFRFSCLQRSEGCFTGMHIENGDLTVLLEQFTDNTLVMAIFKRPLAG